MHTQKLHNFFKKNSKKNKKKNTVITAVFYTERLILSKISNKSTNGSREVQVIQILGLKMLHLGQTKIFPIRGSTSFSFILDVLPLHQTLKTIVT